MPSPRSYREPIRDGHKLTVALGPDYTLIVDIQCPGCDYWRPEHAAEREKEPCWLRAYARSAGSEFLEWWSGGGEAVSLSDGPVEIEWWADGGDDDPELMWRPVTPQRIAAPEAEAGLRAAMEAGCDEAERLGYGSELGYAEAASISEAAVRGYLKGRGMTLENQDRGPEVRRVIDEAAKRSDESLLEACERVATDAVYAARNDGGTMHTAGAAAAHAVLALLEPVDVHIVDIDEEGFTITHPLTERAEGAMHLCKLQRDLRDFGEPPVEPGRYRATPHEPDGYSESYRGDQIGWDFEPVGKGGDANG